MSDPADDTVAIALLIAGHRPDEMVVELTGAERVSRIVDYLAQPEDPTDRHHRKGHTMTNTDLDLVLRPRRGDLVALRADALTPNSPSFWQERVGRTVLVTRITETGTVVVDDSEERGVTATSPWNWWSNPAASFDVVARASFHQSPDFGEGGVLRSLGHHITSAIKAAGIGRCTGSGGPLDDTMYEMDVTLANGDEIYIRISDVVRAEIADEDS